MKRLWLPKMVVQSKPVLKEKATKDQQIQKRPQKATKMAPVLARINEYSVIQVLIGEKVMYQVTQRLQQWREDLVSVIHINCSIPIAANLVQLMHIGMKGITQTTGGIDGRKVGMTERQELPEYKVDGTDNHHQKRLKFRQEITNKIKYGPKREDEETPHGPKRKFQKLIEGPIQLQDEMHFGLSSEGPVVMEDPIQLQEIEVQGLIQLQEIEMQFGLSSKGTVVMAPHTPGSPLPRLNENRNSTASPRRSTRLSTKYNGEYVPIMERAQRSGKDYVGYGNKKKAQTKMKINFEQQEDAIQASLALEIYEQTGGNVDKEVQEALDKAMITDNKKEPLQGGLDTHVE